MDATTNLMVKVAENTFRKRRADPIGEVTQSAIRPSLDPSELSGLRAKARGVSGPAYHLVRVHRVLGACNL